MAKYVDQLAGIDTSSLCQTCWDFYESEVKPLGVSRGQEFVETVARAFAVPLISRKVGEQLNMAIKPGDHVVMIGVAKTFRTLIDMASTCNLWLDRGASVHFVNQRINMNTERGKLIADTVLNTIMWDNELRSERSLEARALNDLRHKRANTKKLFRFHKTKWMSPVSIGNKTVYAKDQERFEEAMLALRLLSEGRTFQEAADTVDAMYRKSMGLPEKRKFSEQPYWSIRSIRHLAQSMPSYIDTMRKIYGERDEYYLNYTPVVRPWRRKLAFPPIPRPVDDNDKRSE